MLPQILPPREGPVNIYPVSDPSRLLGSQAGLLIGSNCCIFFSQIPESSMGLFRQLPFLLQRRQSLVLAAWPGFAELSVEASRYAKAKERRHHESQLSFPCFSDITA